MVHATQAGLVGSVDHLNRIGRMTHLIAVALKDVDDIELREAINVGLAYIEEQAAGASDLISAMIDGP